MQFLASFDRKVQFKVYEGTCILFTKGEDDEWYVLLIKRGHEPYKDCWAFPGGFLNMDETLAQCAALGLCGKHTQQLCHHLFRSHLGCAKTACPFSFVLLCGYCQPCR